jgi:pimeloyl-ACP methyl ester carboxylesterase
VREIEAGGGELGERRVHAGTMARSWTTAPPLGVADPARHTRRVPAHLHHERISPAGAAPAAWLLLTHGIYGAGGNWRAIARKLVERRLDWGVVLVDLRQHGRSEPGEPPHTLDAAPGDLRAQDEHHGGVQAMPGHSFGATDVLAARALAPVRQTWMLDASPGARPGTLSDPSNSVVAVLELLERLPRTWARREDFVAAVKAAGQPTTLAQWLAMNVVADPEGGPELVLRLDLAAVREMLADYFTRDLWAAALSPAGGELELVIADRSSTISADDRARLERAPPHVHVHRVDAGHWLHIEAAEAVIDRFAEHLPRAGDS